MNAQKRFEAGGRAGRAAGFFRSRWQGDVPLERLFWRDAILVGTAISIASSALALFLLGLVLAAHFAPVPYNIFLTLDLPHACRLADRGKVRRRQSVDDDAGCRAVADRYGHCLTGTR